MNLPLSRQIFALVLVLLCLNGCIGEVARNPSQERLDLVEALRERLDDIRGLKFTRPVGFTVETREDINDLLAINQRRSEDGTSFEETSLAYSKLGLIPPGTDLRKGSLNYYSSQALAFYDSERKSIVYVGARSDRQDSSTMPAGAEKIIIHELTHALQDQRFALGDRLRSLKNSDAALALRAVAEGDAIVTEHAYSFGGLNEGLADYVRRVLDGTEDETNPSDTPVMVADKLRFQYWAGARFILHFIGKNSWLPINLIYQHPPLSTKQILHPEKYIEAPDPPLGIKLKRFSGLFPSDWREIENDTLGELLVHCLFKQFLGPEKAARMAEGWEGDRFVVYRRGDEVAFIWATAWDSSADAQEFFDGYQSIVPMKYDARPLERERFYIEKRDRTVLVVEGIDRDNVKGIAENVWGGMEVKKATFEPPPLHSLTRSP